MTALARFLFPVPDVRRNSASILVWWERRRPAYNLVVGGTGLLSLTVLHAISWLPPHVDLRVPLPAIIAYGLGANLCYSLGFAIEAFLQRLWGDDVAPVGPTLFRHGLVFSVGLTLLPIGLAWISWLGAALSAFAR